MEKEKYEKPLFEIIALLDTNIIATSPEEGEVGEEDDDGTENSAPDTAMKMFTSLLPWLDGEEGQEGLTEDENSEAQESSEETTDNENSESESNFGSTLSEGLNELFGDIIPSSKGSLDDGGNEDSSNFTEEVNEPEQTEEMSSEGTGW